MKLRKPPYVIVSELYNLEHNSGGLTITTVVILNIMVFFFNFLYELHKKLSKLFKFDYSLFIFVSLVKGFTTAIHKITPPFFRKLA